VGGRATGDAGAAVSGVAGTRRRRNEKGEVAAAAAAASSSSVSPKVGRLRSRSGSPAKQYQASHSQKSFW